MYSTCLFCHADLGRNEALEAFPVGRRLAYDAAKGRLWVVCRKCERWNLTPQEERWEAIEQAERLYRATRLRTSTDNIGLARLRDRTELVRIGEPLRPEFAAWRYGDQFGRRRRRQLLIAGGGLVALGGLIAGGVAAGISIGGFGWVLSRAAERIVKGDPNAVVARVRTSNTLVEVRRKQLASVSIVRDEAAPFALVLPLRLGTMRLSGEEALQAAGALLPATNRFGGSRWEVASAVGRIEASGGPEALIGAAARAAGPHARVDVRGAAALARAQEGAPFGLDKITRLALEMALHEEQERRAMAGELAPLERAWREAEEIAAIADDLLLPPAIGERLDQLRGRSSARAGAASSPERESGSASSS